MKILVMGSSLCRTVGYPWTVNAYFLYHQLIIEIQVKNFLTHADSMMCSPKPHISYSTKIDNHFFIAKDLGAGSFYGLLRYRIENVTQQHKRFLLADFYWQLDELIHADRNLIMLAIILFRTYNKKRDVDLDMTPDVVRCRQVGLIVWSG